MPRPDDLVEGGSYTVRVMNCHLGDVLKDYPHGEAFMDDRPNGLDIKVFPEGSESLDVSSSALRIALCASV